MTEKPTLPRLLAMATKMATQQALLADADTADKWRALFAALRRPKQ